MKSDETNELLKLLPCDYETAYIKYKTRVAEKAVEAIDRLVTEARIAELEVVKSQITEAHMILSPCGYRHTIDNILHPEIIEDRIAQLQSQLNKETT